MTTDQSAPADIDALERALRKVETPLPGDAKMRDMLLVAVAELRAARETNRALEGIAAVAEAYLTARGKPWFESHANDALRALKARLAERKAAT